MTAKMVIASAERLIEVRHFLPEEEKDRRDERPGVPDADPEHKVRDVPRPATGTLEGPRLPIPSQKSHETATPRRLRSAQGRDEEEPPADWCRPLERLGDNLGD
jgi:hypothetical protein